MTKTKTQPSEILRGYVDGAIDYHLGRNPDKSITKANRRVLTAEIVTELRDSLDEVVARQMERWDVNDEYNEHVNSKSNYFDSKDDDS